MGQEYLFLIMNELFLFEKIFIFLEKKPFLFLFAFLLIDLGGGGVCKPKLLYII